MGIKKSPEKGDDFLCTGLPSVPKGVPEAPEERLLGAQSARRKLSALDQHLLVI